MKKLTWLHLVLPVLAVSMARGQIVIENPARPAAENAGRVIDLKEELRIEDTGKEFYLKYPKTIRVSPNGDLLIEDGSGQALHFDSQGRFVRNLRRKGQGPGEMSHLHDIWISENRIFLLGSPGKILLFDYEGRLLRDIGIRISSVSGMEFVWADAARAVITRQRRPAPETSTGLMNFLVEIVEIPLIEGEPRTIGSFPIPGYFEILGNGGTCLTTWNHLQSAALDAETFFFNASPEFLVEIFSREVKTVDRRFKRPYRRVKNTATGGVPGGGGTEPDPPKFVPNISALHVMDGNILVQTSTVHKDKGVLFDVFDQKGRYIDCFYIRADSASSSHRVNGNRCAFSAGCYFYFDTNDEGFAVIKKCRLVGF